MTVQHAGKVLVTGASGFLGLQVAKHCVDFGWCVTGSVRKSAANSYPFLTIELDLLAELGTEKVKGYDCVVHCAAQVPAADIDETSFNKINIEGTRKLALAAAKAGVRRFVFISTIKVNGETSSPNNPFTEEDIPKPSDLYARSKYQAEQELLGLVDQYDMEVVIIRAPLIYGPEVKGNFRGLVNLVNKRLPLPFGCIDNKRSLVAVDNLADFVCLCLNHPKAANQIFLVSDGEDLSLPELIGKIANAQGRRAINLPVPVSLIGFLARLLGRPDALDKLAGSLQVDINKARNLLGWEPQVSVDDAIRRAIDNP